MPNISQQPKMRIHMINNLCVSFQFLEQEKIRLVGIGAEGLSWLTNFLLVTTLGLRVVQISSITSRS